MKTSLALLALTACLRAAAAAPLCPVDGFYPASGTPQAYWDIDLANPKPRVIHDDEEIWFDYIEVYSQYESGWKSIYDVAVYSDDKGGFRVVLVRVKGADGGEPGPGVVESRDLPALLAQRLHRGVMPILARTHYPADLVQKRPANDIVCTDGLLFAATVSQVDARFTELSGEAMLRSRNSGAGVVQALGHALREYALHRIDPDGLDEPLKRVEAHATTDSDLDR